MLKKVFTFSLKDTAISLLIMAAAVIVAELLKVVGSSDVYTPLILVLAVLLISRCTNGFFYGIISSVVGSILINYFYTYPYFEFGFVSIDYFITFTCMVIVAVVTCVMTSEIKQHEQLHIEAEREKMRSNLLRSVSHDLRTPLTSIIGTTSAVIDNQNILSAEKKRQLLEDVVDDAQWLIRIVENLLSITRLNDDGNTKLHTQCEAIEEIIGDVVPKFKKRFPDVALTVKIPDKLILVDVDAILIEQVLINLLENAVIHGETTSEACIAATLKPGVVIISVSDNGKGISNDIIPHIFDGTLSPSGISDSKRNMGIGLSVCNTIIAAHNGTLTARNNINGGAEFLFTLPLDRREI